MGRTAVTMSEDMIARMKDLWNRNHKPSDIGQILKEEYPDYPGALTRSAILGKIWRERKGGRSFNSRSSINLDPWNLKAEKLRKRRIRDRKVRARKRSGGRNIQQPDLTPLNHPSFMEAVSQPITLIELREHNCRWPIEVEKETYYCGKQKHSIAYCKEHTKVSIRVRS